MCPDWKLKWFKDHGRTAAQIRDIKKLVVNRWKELYQGAANDTETPATGLVLPRLGKPRKRRLILTPSAPVTEFGLLYGSSRLQPQLRWLQPAQTLGVTLIRH
jgi:hypothetical protein